MKKGQIAIFVIFGFVILLAFGLILYLRDSNNAEVEKSIIIPLNVQPIHNFVETCLKNSLKEVIDLVAIQGGYFNEPPFYLNRNFNGLDIPYNFPFYYQHSGLSPISLSEIENEISNGLSTFKEKCSNLSVFPYEFLIDEKPMTVSTIITPSSVDVKVNLPIDVTIGNTRHKLDEFSVPIDSNLLDLYEIAVELSSIQFENENSLCLTCLLDVANENEVLLRLGEMEDEENYIIVYTVFEDNSSENPSELVFAFAHQFDLEQDGTLPIYIEEIGILKTSVDYGFEYKVNAFGNNLEFSDDSYLFDIDPETGLFSFTPSYADSGTHLVTITARDDNGQVYSELFTLEVENFGAKPKIDYIGFLDVRAGQNFTYQINAKSEDNLKLTYLTNTSLFYLQPELGVIVFVPELGDIGSHDFTITVIDEKGNFNIEKGKLFVSE